MNQVQENKLYVLKGKTLNEIKKRRIRGKQGEIAVDTDAKGNALIRFEKPVRCLLVDSGELRYGFVPIRWE
jgi:hypothetical protein